MAIHRVGVGIERKTWTTASNFERIFPCCNVWHLLLAMERVFSDIRMSSLVIVPATWVHGIWPWKFEAVRVCL